MGFLQLLLGGMQTIVFYGILFAGVYKLFTIANDLAEIKEILRKRVDPLPPLPEDMPAREWTVLDSPK